MLIFFYQQDEHDDRMKTMSEFKVQKRNGGVIHAGYEYDEYLMSDCGAGRRTTRSGGTEARTWVKVEGEITCKRCLKKLAAEAPTATVDEHAAAVAQMRANIDAEEEERAAARRARNRTNYATASHPVGRKLAKDHGLNFF